ncbi:hypothetical protein ACFQ29_01410 [Longispora fulva]|uniref:Uncharacterized protein n=1 Tax=Longispora fulva TaxID=619741 RepID=A0A8J7KT22_9ACTN|nr:hypothetical protein [Longispora fulva]MBG6140247.1 hypothetical protein [Longispora fulva]
MTDSASNGNGKIVITLKAGADFAAPWIVIHADNASDADATLTGIFNGGLHEKVTRAGAMLAATRPAAAGNSAPPARQAAAPAPASLPPGVAAEYCEHGERIFKSGVSKSSGKPYKMLACPQNTCAPAWLK